MLALAIVPCPVSDILPQLRCISSRSRISSSFLVRIDGVLVLAGSEQRHHYFFNKTLRLAGSSATRLASTSFRSDDFLTLCFLVTAGFSGSGFRGTSLSSAGWKRTGLRGSSLESAGLINGGRSDPRWR